MRVLITGGAGFIGRGLCSRLLSEGHDVRVLDNLSPQVHGEAARPPAEIAERTDFVLGDVRDPSAWRATLRGADAVVHLAAETGMGQSMYRAQHYSDVNVSGAAALCDAVAEESPDLSVVVVASTCRVYGEGAYDCPRCGRVYPSPRSRQDLSRGLWEPVCPTCGDCLGRPLAVSGTVAARPQSVYAATKLAQEHVVRAVLAARGIPVAVLRLQNVYGEGQALSNPYTGLLAAFAARVLGGRPLEVYEDGAETRDFVHVTDVVTAIVKALALGPGADATLDVGSGTATSIAALAQLFLEVSGSSVGFEVTGSFRLGDVRNCFADIGDASELLGFSPAVSLEDGLRSFFEWARTIEGVLDRSGDATSELQERGFMG